MPRKGKGTELIVKGLEKLIADELAIVKSPDYIYDPVAKINREVDISIKGKLGSHDILVIIECRDRPSKPAEDVTWVEQVISKTKDLNANKTVMVSTTNFSHAATNKAHANGIETRLLKAFDPSEVIEWVNKIDVQYLNYRWSDMTVYAGAVDSSITGTIDPEKVKPPLELAKYPMQASSKVFIVGQTDKCISIDDLMNNVQDLVYQGIEYNSSPVEKSFNFLFYDPSQLLFMELGDKRYRVIRLAISANFSVDSTSIPVGSAQRYYSEENAYAEKLDYTWVVENGDELTFSVQRDLQANMQNVLFFVKKPN